MPRLTSNVVMKSATPAVPTLRGGTETILLVEDDPALRVAVRKALSQLGYRMCEPKDKLLPRGSVSTNPY